MWFDLDKFVGVDVSEPVSSFDEFVRARDLKQIRTYYGVSQANRGKIESIIVDEFGDTPIDLIIDDASHHYAATRHAFEISFPSLRPGGSYVIEDWGWAHWPSVTRFGATPR